jgi:ferritin
MKGINKRKRSLSEETEKLLNQQVEKEAVSSAIYLSMASWCEINGFENSAAFLYDHTEEENMHMMKIFRYINETGGHALVPEITGIKHEFGSLREVFDEVLEHEIYITNSIHEIVNHCYNTKDFTTFNFLQWFVTEQREEETLARRLVELFDIIGEDGIGLWTIDQEIGKMASSGGDAGANASDSQA